MAAVPTKSEVLASELAKIETKSAPTHFRLKPSMASMKRAVPASRISADRCHWAIGQADIDKPDRHPVVGVDDIDVTSRCAALDGSGRHSDDIVQRLHEKLGVDELIRKQCVVSIVELCSHFRGTAGGVDPAVIAATRPAATILTLARS